MRWNSPLFSSFAASIFVAGFFPASAAAQFRYPPPYPYGAYAAPEASLRIAVTPREAAVYVDGYFAGPVDDFDGVFQRLHIAPGQHEIGIYLEGYRPLRQQLYLSPSSTRKISGTLERLAPGEPSEAPPVPMAPPRISQGPPPQRQPPPPRGPQAPPNEPAGESLFGTVIVRVQPSGADISIDGERWAGPQGDERLIVQLSEGRHVVEIRKGGYRAYTTEVELRRGETVPLNVSLTR